MVPSLPFFAHKVHDFQHPPHIYGPNRVFTAITFLVEEGERKRAKPSTYYNYDNQPFTAASLV